MKRKIIGVLLALFMCSSIASGLCACKSDPPPASGAVGKISSTLLDGKIANFLGAEGIGVKDKNQTSSTPAANPLWLESNGQTGADSTTSLFSATTFANQGEEEHVQKKNELVKQTENGQKDVHFYSSEGRSGYKDLNKQFNNHHHKGEECKNANCEKISDEIEAQEQEDQTNTIIALDARINKLYNYGNFTFFSVSSAVEGKVTINGVKNRLPTPVQVGEEDVYINMGDVNEAVLYGASFIVLEDGLIPIKQYENEAVYHKANYWCDDYNQSYITDNFTGKTYSLSQFPRIFSVDNGLIKVYNNEANGKFDYYEPVVQDGEISFNKIILPTKEEFSIGFSTTYEAVKIDTYGNVVINSNIVVDDSIDNTFDENGEKKVGANIIVAVKLESTKRAARQLDKGNLRFERRYSNATKYHKASDGRIYRVNFVGDLSNISVNVLNENGQWQEVENKTDVTFDGGNGYILWMYSQDSTISDCFKITKIVGGYAYYSTAALSDGVMVWAAHIADSSLIRHGEYSGVVKIPTGGPVFRNGEEVPYEHLDYYQELFIYHSWSGTGTYNVFLVGATQMLILKGETGGGRPSGELYLIDVATGNEKALGITRFMTYNKYCVYFDQLGWVSLKEEFDFANCDKESMFSEQPIDYHKGLDAYFQFVVDKLS